MRATLVRSMRPSLVTRGGHMPGPKTYNLWWGDKNRPGRLNGSIEYTISPFQAKAAPNMFKEYAFNGYRRLSAEAIFWVVPFSVCYGIYSWGKSYDAWQNSKAGHIALEGHGH